MDKKIKENSFYSIVEVSEKFVISQKTVRRHIASGKLKAIKIGGVYRIPKSSLEDFINLNEEDYSFDLFGNKIFLEDKKKKSKKNITHNYKNNSKDDINWVDIVDHWERIKPSKLTFCDLFSGAGGISKGFELAGLQGVCGLEIGRAHV